MSENESNKDSDLQIKSSPIKKEETKQEEEKKFKKIFCYRQQKSCRYTKSEIQDSIFECIHDIAKT